MRQTRLPVRNLAAPIRWFRAGNDPTWPKAPDRRRQLPSGGSHNLYPTVPPALTRADIVFG